MPAAQAHPFSQPHQRHIHKESDRIVQRTLSGCFGRGGLNHNNRFVNKDRIRDDIVICQRSLKQLYHELFDEVLEEYNDKQKRRDRKIANYQEQYAFLRLAQLSTLVRVASRQSGCGHRDRFGSVRTLDSFYNK